MTNPMTLQGLEAFLTRYKNCTAQQAAQQFQAFARSFRHIRTALDDIKARGQVLERQHAPRFNLFRLLGVTRDEVRTHSAFLADLLTPEGIHGQGIVFLDAFLTYCRQKWADFPKPQGAITSALWTIGPKNTSFGNLDLVIAAPVCKVLLVIEHKIGAAEQPDQLQRYSQWMQQQTSCPPEGKALLYLTPDGRPSSTAAEARYYQLSYREDIAAWLHSTLGEVEAPPVREALAQYLDVVTTL